MLILEKDCGLCWHVHPDFVVEDFGRNGFCIFWWGHSPFDWDLIILKEDNTILAKLSHSNFYSVFVFWMSLISLYISTFIWLRLTPSTFYPPVFLSLPLFSSVPSFLFHFLYPFCTFLALLSLSLPLYLSPVIPCSPLSSTGQAWSDARLAEAGILHGPPGWAWMERQKGPWLNWHMHHRVWVMAPLCQTLYLSNITNSSERRGSPGGPAGEPIIEKQAHKSTFIGTLNVSVTLFPLKIAGSVLSMW